MPRILIIVAVLAVLVAVGARYFASPDVKKLISSADDLNDRCRGGSGDDPKTMKACDERDQLVEKLKSLGWCWGPRKAAGFEQKWMLCKDDPDQR